LSDHESASATAVELTGVIDCLVDDDLAAYLLDSDTADEIIDWIHQETSIRKLYLIPIFKLLTPLVLKGTKKAATWGGGKLAEKSRCVLMSLRYSGAVFAWLTKLKQRLSDKAADKKLLDDICSGKRPPRDFEDGKALTQELKLQLRTLAETEELGDALKGELQELRNMLSPQPPLRIKLLDPKGRMRLHFRARRVPFVGRTSEKARLTKFLESERSFCWEIVTGAGGQGKSRLALEICLKNGNGWRTGFLPREFDFTTWETWQPDRPTLMIVDYASGRTDLLRRIICSLQERQADLEWPVRLLLIERQADGKWWEDLIRYNSEAGAVDEARFSPDEFVLSGLSEDDTWATMEHIITGVNSATLPDRSVAMDALREIDAEPRPLYAAMAAEAIVLGEDIRGWSKTELLDNILGREMREFWEPAGVTVLDKNLLALATMLGGLPTDVLNDPPEGLALPPLDHSADAFKKQRYEVMTGQSVTDSLAPLEPDIVGEYFVLEHFKPEIDSDTKRSAAVASLGWAINPVACALFLSHAGRDFTSHPTLRGISVLPEASTVDIRVLWSAVTFNWIIDFGKKGDLTRAQELLDGLSTLTDRHPDEPALRERLAESVFNFMNYCLLKGEVSRAQDLFDGLSTLAEGHPAEPALRKCVAMGAVNLISSYCGCGDLSRAHDSFVRLSTMALEYSDEPALRVEVAKATFNLIDFYGQRGDTSRAHELFKSLTALAKEHPDESALREFVAKAALNLVDDFGREGDLTRAGDVFGCLSRLVEAHLDEPILRVGLAKCAYVLIHYYLKVGLLESARKIALANADLLLSDEFLLHVDRTYGGEKALEFRKMIEDFIALPPPQS
jgi:hypothetical protein